MIDFQNDICEIYNETTGKFQRFEWCVVTSDGYVRHIVPGTNDFFKSEDGMHWHGEMIRGVPENRKHALRYNTLTCKKISESFFTKFLDAEE